MAQESKTAIFEYEGNNLFMEFHSHVNTNQVVKEAPPNFLRMALYLFVVVWLFYHYVLGWFL